MLNEAQKEKLINHICGLIRESIAENGYFENAFMEKEKHARHTNGDDEGMKSKRESVMKWLDTAQELHSVLSYELWPELDKDTARSEFSKKYRGEDADGNSYSFDDDDITKLYNMKDDFINRID